MTAAKKSPFDKFNTDARRTRGEDPHLELWKAWENGGRKEEHLEPLLDALEPTIKQHAKKAFSGIGGSIPYSALEAKYRASAKQSLDKFSPTGGAKVKTWVITEFRRTTDFVDANRNFSGVPKPRVALYQRYQNAKNEFMTQHGHEPTLEELKVLMPDIPETQLRPLMKEFRRELFIGGSPDPEAHDDGSLGHSPSEVRTVLSLAPALLSPEEKRVFDALFPPGGSKTSIEQVARKVNLTPNQVYRIRAAIYSKVKPHLQNI